MDLRIGIFGWVEHYLILVDGMILMYYGKVSRDFAFELLFV
jgi:hypothetical protein